MIIVGILNGLVEVSFYLLGSAMLIGAIAGLIRVWFKRRQGFAGPPESREPKVMQSWRATGVRQR